MATASVSPPDWLTMRSGALSPGIRPEIVFVLLGGEPQYKLEVHPAAGTFICAVSQTNNGRRLDDATTYPNPAAALAGGLDQLRAKLGW